MIVTNLKAGHIEYIVSQRLKKPDYVPDWIARAVSLGFTIPSTPVQNALKNFVTSLDAAGLMSRMKTGYILHAGSKEMATLNLKDPLTYQSTLVNSPLFSEGNGMKSGGNSYIDQPFKANEYNGIQNDLTAIQYISESSTVGSGEASHGFGDESGFNFFMYPLRSSGNALVFSYTDSGQTVPNTNHKGLYIHRGTGTQSITWKDGVKYVSSIPQTPPTSIPQNRLILASNTDGGGGDIIAFGFYTKYVAADFLFDGFNDADELNFRTAFNTYKTAVGLP